MINIKTNITRLIAFISNSYCTKEALELPQGDCVVSFDTTWELTISDNGAEFLLLSMIRHIQLPDDAYYPQLRSLYGLPAGLFSIKKPRRKEKEKREFEKIPENSNLTYLFVRRSLLHATVWYIKSLKSFKLEQLTVIQNVVSSMLDNDEDLLCEITKDLMGLKFFPKEAPGTVTLSSSQYDYACLWFGRKLSALLFQGEKMPAEYREWFISLRNFDSLNKIPTPSLFARNLPTIVAYVIVQKAVEQEDCSSENLLRLINMIGLDGDVRQRVLFISLFYVGLYNSMADHYYFTSNANSLMSILEKAALLLSVNANENLEQEWTAAFDKLRNINSFDNCLTYYQTKFPDLNGRAFFEYNKGDKRKKGAEEIIVLPPEACHQFLMDSGRIVDIPQNAMQNVFYIDSCYTKEFSKFGFQFIGKNKTTFDIFLKKFSTTEPIDIVSMESKESICNSLPFLSVGNVIPIVDRKSKVWIIQMSSLHGWTPFAQSVLMQAYKKIKPELMLFLYFCDGFPKKEKKRNKAYSMELIGKTQENPNYGSEMAFLQRNLNNLFPKSHIIFLPYVSDQNIWETVRMGENILSQYDWEDISIIELRSEKNRHEQSSLIPRMVRDVIVYDKNQKYLFMNLN